MEAYFGEINPLLVLGAILGLVEFLKRLGVKDGNKPIFASMGVGVGLGILFQVQEMYPVIAPWFKTGFYGILMGLTASGLYKLPSSMGFGSRAEPPKTDA
jgi:hypothetical protein